MNKVRECGMEEDPWMTTPFGFAHRLGWDELGEFHDLIREGMKDKKLSESIEYRLKVIRLAKKYFVDFNLWIKKQVDDGYLYGRRLDFTKDTIRFIETGRRELSVNNWGSLMEWYPNKKEEAIRNAGKELLANNTKFQSIENIISMWCSRKGGFEDMLWSLGILCKEGSDEPNREPMNSSAISVKVKY